MRLLNILHAFIWTRSCDVRTRPFDVRLQPFDKSPRPSDVRMWSSDMCTLFLGVRKRSAHVGSRISDIRTRRP